jgi:DNA topoisomerase IB
VLNWTEQARRVTTALNSLLWSKYILVKTKQKKIMSQLENVDFGFQSKEKIMKYIHRFLDKSCKDLQTNKSKKGSHQRKNVGKQTILERVENNMLKWYELVVCMDDKEMA